MGKAGAIRPAAGRPDLLHGIPQLDTHPIRKTLRPVTEYAARDAMKGREPFFFVMSTGLAGRTGRFSKQSAEKPFPPLKRSAIPRRKKAGHIRVLPFQQRYFSINSAGISGQAAVCADHPMTGNEDGYWIAPDRSANCLRGGPGKPSFFSKLPRNFAIGCGSAIGNLQ